MANIIDTSFFVNEICIPGLEKDGIESKLCSFIKKYEPDFLRQALGVSFYSLFNTGLQTVPIPDRWNKLLNGCDYVNQQGQKYTWIGFKDKSMNCIANWVYVFYRRSTMGSTTSAGPDVKAKTENSTVITTDEKVTRAISETVQLVRGNPGLCDDEESGYLWHFLLYAWDATNNCLIYPEFNLRIMGWKSINTSNSFGI